MANFPNYCFTGEYKYSVSPDLIRTEYSSRRTRQRTLFGNPNYSLSLSHRLTSAELDTFETFVLDTLSNGADTYTGKYYIGDYESAGAMRIQDGAYSFDYVTEGLFDVKYTADLIDRSFDEEQNIYELVNEYGGFSDLYGLIQATEDTINFNNL